MDEKCALINWGPPFSDPAVLSLSSLEFHNKSLKSVSPCSPFPTPLALSLSPA